MRDVLSETIEVRGGTPELFARLSGEPYSHRWPSGNDYINVGGYCIANARMANGDHIVELRQCGMDTPPMTGRRFDNAFDAINEYERIHELLTLRAQVMACMDVLVDGCQALPEAFVPHVRAGDFSTLLIAADYQDDAGETDKAIILRAAYHRLMGEVNVQVKAAKKLTLWLNVQQTSKRNPTGYYKQTSLEMLKAAMVEEGVSVRTVSVSGYIRPGIHTNEPPLVVREFKVGDVAEYDSYNLSYHGPIFAITAKTVTVQRSIGANARMAMANFVETNYRFDLATATKRNNEWSD